MYHWSKMSGKLEGIPALNTDTTSNEFCKKMKNTESICKICYSWSMLQTFRKNAVPSFKRNSDFLSEEIHNPKYLLPVSSIVARFNGHGELINKEHFINIINICRNQPNTTFTLWTKRKDIVNKVCKTEKLPKNLIMVYSNKIVDTIMKKVPKHFHKVFNNVSNESSKINCRGKCIDCMKCYTIGNKTEQIIERIK
jgi:uncharacterized protein YlzI (FlbEa/FlbD family)